ncbi:protein of unknown function [Methylorubrum extorquens]|uniref:Polyphosphate kinase-2-related domain-containing protein n=1 Tax=Methylorubrum extorquens TaxID=408 RepID=A0A2N9AW99_METEX|nr:protein of unknown function [Methylorubrum extorquens]
MHDIEQVIPATKPDAGRPQVGTAKKLKKKDYERELHTLQVKLCHLQDWVKRTGARIIIVFEGRDAAGKGGTIKAITERVSPRVFRVVALPVIRPQRSGPPFSMAFEPGGRIDVEEATQA